jgi:hypothetical protein
VDLIGRAGADIGRRLVFGEVVGIHLDDRFILQDGRVDTLSMQVIGRTEQRNEYLVVDKVFQPGLLP